MGGFFVRNLVKQGWTTCFFQLCFYHPFCLADFLWKYGTSVWIELIFNMKNITQRILFYTISD